MNQNAGYGARVKRGLPGACAFLTKGKQMGKTDETIRVLLADDYPATRADIHAMLEKVPDIEIVGEARDGVEAQRLVAELGPDVLLLDLVMPGPQPHEIERWVRTHYPETITLVLTAHDRNYYLAKMIEAGVAGFLTKEEPTHQLVEAIRRAVRGEYLITSRQRDRVNRWREEVGKRWESLTGREREVLRLLVQGLGNAEIAEKLDVAVKTIEQHVTRILKKLVCNSRLEAVVWVRGHLPDDLFEDSQDDL